MCGRDLNSNADTNKFNAMIIWQMPLVALKYANWNITFRANQTELSSVERVMKVSFTIRIYTLRWWWQGGCWWELRQFCFEHSVCRNHNEQVNIDYITHLPATKCTCILCLWNCLCINKCHPTNPMCLQLKMIRVEYSRQPLVKPIKPSVTRT